jgi:hypothetical protein
MFTKEQSEKAESFILDLINRVNDLTGEDANKLTTEILAMLRFSVHIKLIDERDADTMIDMLNEANGFIWFVGS